MLSLFLSVASGDKNSACNYKPNLERMSNSIQSTRPVGRVLWRELHVFSSFMLKFEGETSFFCVLAVKSFCQYMGCRL